MKVTKFFSHVLLMMILLAMPSIMQAQNQKVKLTGKNITLKMAFEQVEKQTGLSVDYDANVIDVNKVLKVIPQTGTLQDVLTQILKGTGYKHSVNQSHVIITLPAKTTPQPRKVTSDASSTLKPISGTVTDTKGEPLLGVSVLVRGANRGTMSDMNGKFKVDAEQGATIILSYIGYEKQQVLVENDNIIHVKMLENSTTLGEVVSIGYGKVKKSDMTGAVGVIKADKIDPLINTQAALALQGKIPGVTIALNEGGGTPGWGNNIVIRGIGSVSTSGTGPLILLDNMPINDMNNINPEDIESIQVLKDASAAAIYGSRAANGVIIITTKQGVKGKIKVTANADFGIQQITKKLDMCTTDEWLKVITEMYKPSNSTLPQIAQHPQVTGAGTDWQDALYRSVAQVKNYAVSVNGGSNDLTYNVSANYMDQEGAQILNNFKRFVTRASSVYTKGRLKLGQTAMITNLQAEDGIGRASQGAVMMIPAYQIYNSAVVGGFQNIGTDVYNGAVNPVGLKTLGRFAQQETNKIDLNFFGEFTLLDGLVFKSNYTSSHSSYDKRYQREANNLTGTATEPRYMERVAKPTYFWQIENTLSYNKVFAEKHSINAVIGQTASRTTTSELSTSGTGLPKDIWEFTDQSTTAKYLQTNTQASSLESYLGRLIYSYDNRYLLTGTFRRDGSSKFYITNRWGNFSSLAAGWNIANEQFFKNLNTPVSVLKLRASMGELGNANIDNYQYFRTITAGTSSALIGDPSTIWASTVETTIANTDVKWEKTATKNLGLDLEMWNGKLTYTVDVYNKITTDMLMNVDGGSTPLSVGVSGNSVWLNAGKLSNNGVEMALTYNGKVRDFSYSVTGIYSHLTNKLESLNEGRTSIPGGGYSTPVIYSKEGYPVYGFFLVKTDGLFRSQAEIDAYTKNGTKIQPNAQVGDQKFVDANGDGKIDTDDKVYCGSPFPAHEFSLRLDGQWKGFDASVFFQGVTGNKVYNVNRMYTEGGDRADGGIYIVNFSTALLNSYTFNTNSNIPRLDKVDKNGNGIDYSDRWLEDGSYLRLKTAQIGYTLPSALMKKISIDRCRFYIAADNLFTLTNYSGYSPDVSKTGGNSGIDNSWSPAIKSYHVGLQLNF